MKRDIQDLAKEKIFLLSIMLERRTKYAVTVINELREDMFLPEY